jgi:hypothetical protein
MEKIIKPATFKKMDRKRVEGEILEETAAGKHNVLVDVYFMNVPSVDAEFQKIAERHALL